MGKLRSLPKFAAKKQRHDPLDKQITRDFVVEEKVVAGPSKRERKRGKSNHEEVGSPFNDFSACRTC
jgi:essential nuclear protein 1